MSEKKRRVVRYKPNYDAQLSFQLYSTQKQIMIEQVQNGNFNCLGDVARQAVDEFIQNHSLGEQDES